MKATVLLGAIGVATLLVACNGPTPDGGNVSGGASSAETAFRTEFRTNFQRECVEGARERSGAELDFAPVCGCAADRMLAEHSMADLVTPPTREMLEPVMLACLREHSPG